MSEKNLNFDQPVERRGTHSLKYDFAEERGRKKDILPLWVADMDFKTSSFVQENSCVSSCTEDICQALYQIYPDCRTYP